MSYNRKQNLSFVQKLDRTAEKNLLLWLPCVILLTFIMVSDWICDKAKSAFSRKVAVYSANAEIRRKPLALKAVAMTLAVAFSFMLVPECSFTASAERLYFDYGYLTLRSEHGYYSVVSCARGVDNIVIPSEFNNQPVEAIYGLEISNSNYEGAFQDTFVESVVLPNSISEIGAYSFMNCFYLNSINIPDTTGRGYGWIGIKAFMNCTSLKNITIPKSIQQIAGYNVDGGVFENCTALEQVTFPEEANMFDNGYYLGERCFANCIALKNINLPKLNSDNPQKIGIRNNTFEGCLSLEEISIPDGYFYINDEAFLNCFSLKKITIPKSVKEIGNNVFTGCDNLKIYGYSGTYAEKYANDNNIPFVYVDEPPIANGKCGDNAFWELSSDGILTISGSGDMYDDELYFFKYFIKSVVIDHGITKIGNKAFWCCNNIESVFIPDSITCIGNRSFYSCKNLKNIAIPNSVISIDDSAFSDCESLTNIIIPNSVLSIGHGAFENCTNLSNVILPNSITEISSSMFENCEKLNNIVIPNSVISIGHSAFDKCSNLTDITIPSSVENIGYYAFCRCSSLVNVKISEGVTTIDNYAFMDCINLSKITIPDGVTSIGFESFYKCVNLTDIIIPQSVTSIYWNSFYECNDELTFYGYAGSYAENYANENNIPFKDISEYPGEEASGEYKLHINYIGRPDLLDVNDIKLYDELVFSFSGFSCDAEEINSADILLKKYDDDSIVKTIPKYNDFYNSSAISVTGQWSYFNNTIDFDISKSVLFDYFQCNTKYYLDLSELKIDGKTILSSQKCKEKYSFTVGFSVKLGEQTFKFANANNDFLSSGESGYVLSKPFRETEIDDKFFFHPFKKNKLYNEMNKNWDGSCEGISALMLLQNNGYIKDCFPEINISYFNSVGNYPKPNSTYGKESYSTRDIINYIQILSSAFGSDIKITRGTDEEKINYILERAESITDVKDCFKLGYNYRYEDKDNNGGIKEAGHAVVVVGGSVKNKILYVYDSNHLYTYYDTTNKRYEPKIRVIPVSIEGGVVYFNDNEINPQYNNVYNINYVNPLSYTSFLPDKISNNTRITADVSDIVHTIIKNPWGSATFFDDCQFEGNIVPEDVYYLEKGKNSSEMMIILPPDTYYEITTDTGALDYDIVNDDMFFAAKSDRAEKSIVSADDGIKLIGSSGNFELTVSTENMPYNMFDISGISSGDVSCQYTAKGVEVDLDHTSDTKVTFYDGLDTTDYTVPEKYDKFLIGEKDDEEAIFVDDDGDGNYETNIIEETETKYSITIPETVTVTHNGAVLSNSSKLSTGDVLTITASVPSGKTLKTLKVNGTEIANGGTYTVVTENIIITVEYDSGSHTHSFGIEWKNDKKSHWHECSCGEKANVENHIPNIPAATATQAKICTICGYVIQKATSEHAHSFGATWKYDSTSHWRECSCGVRTDIASHNSDKVTVTVEPTATTSGTRIYSCSVCGYIMRTETIPATGNYIPSNPTYPSNPIIPANPPTNSSVSNNNLPQVQGSDKAGWDSVIEQILLTPDGGTVTVNMMNGTEELPKNVVECLMDRNVNLVLLMGGSTKWTINGLSVTSPKTVDMGVRKKKKTHIPDELLESVSMGNKSVQVVLDHKGSFGFTATLTIDLGEKYNGMYANLFYYNSKAKELEFISSGIIRNGRATLVFTHASEYAVVISKEPLGDYQDVSSAAGTTADSIPIDFTAPVTDGIAIPAIKIPQFPEYSTKKRRYRILRKRRLDDLVFVY